MINAIVGNITITIASKLSIKRTFREFKNTLNEGIVRGKNEPNQLSGVKLSGMKLSTLKLSKFN